MHDLNQLGAIQITSARLNRELRAQEAAAAAAERVQGEHMENEEGIDACENPGTSQKGTAAEHEARHENYVWGLKGNHMAQKAGLRTKTTPGARCRLQAISDMKEIYTTAANPVVLTDLKREFQSYLEANNLCQGQIPEELKVHVGSRIKLFEPKTHTGLGYAYAHQKINGRGRCAIDL